MFLRQSTSQVIQFGPCLDKTDGVTEETALTLAQADMRLSKDGGAFAEKNATGNATHDSDGWYSTTFDTTDTATVGILKLNVHQPANMLPIWETFYVVEENIYDAWYAASGGAGTDLAAILVDTAEIGSTGAGLTSLASASALATVDTNIDSILVDTAEIGTAGAGLSNITLPAATIDLIWDETMAGHTTADTSGLVMNELQDGGRLDLILDARMAEASIDTTGGAIDVVTLVTTTTTNTDMVGTDGAYTGTPPTAAAISDVVWDELQADHTTVATMGLMASELASVLVDTNELQTDNIPGTLSSQDTNIAAIKSETALIVADTNELQTDDVPGLISTLDAVVDTVKAETVLIVADTNEMQGDLVNGGRLDLIFDELTTNIDAVETDTQNIQSRLPTSLVSGAMDSDVSVIQNNVITAASINTSALTAAKLATDAIDKIRDGLLPTQNVAFSNIEFLFVDNTDGKTPVTSASGTAVTRSIDGGAFASGTGTLAEVGNGIYQYDASAADMNGGIITFRFVATGGTPNAPDDRFLTIITGGGV